MMLTRRWHRKERVLLALLALLPPLLLAAASAASGRPRLQRHRLVRLRIGRGSVLRRGGSRPEESASSLSSLLLLGKPTQPAAKAIRITACPSASGSRSPRSTTLSTLTCGTGTGTAAATATALAKGKVDFGAKRIHALLLLCIRSRGRDLGGIVRRHQRLRFAKLLHTLLICGARTCCGERIAFVCLKVAACRTATSYSEIDVARPPRRGLHAARSCRAAIRCQQAFAKVFFKVARERQPR